MTVGITYRALPGFFQGYPKVNSKDIDATKTNHLSFVNHSNWKQVYDSLPKDTDNKQYKLMLVARHGQGYHNAAIVRYGEPKWDAYWSLLNGDEYGQWNDSKLTPLGKKQVITTGEEILLPIINQIGILPHKFFCSPMRRCLETFIESWTPVFKANRNLMTDVIYNNVFENVRETLGEHTCDKRVNHSVTVNEYQDYKLSTGQEIRWLYQPDYPEEDQLWRADYRELDSEMDERINNGLLQIFESLEDEDKLLSLTCHAGVINSVLRNMEHPAIKNLATGQMVPIIVEIEK